MSFKIAVNTCFGGFGLSKEAVQYIKERLPEATLKKIREEYYSDKENSDDITWHDDNFTLDDAIGYYAEDMKRHDPLLIEAILNVENPNGMCADINIVEINDNMYWIKEYDGQERVMTRSSIPWITIED